MISVDSTSTLVGWHLELTTVVPDTIKRAHQQYLSGLDQTLPLSQRLTYYWPIHPALDHACHVRYQEHASVKLQLEIDVESTRHVRQHKVVRLVP